MTKKLSQKQIENLHKHNEKQRAKRKARRNKRCLWCDNFFIDSSKRLTQNTCSKKCARSLGVAKRKQNGSYERTPEQNKKMVTSIQNLRERNVWEITKEKKEKLSQLLKERWDSGEMHEKSKETSLAKYGVPHPMQSDATKRKLKETFRKKYKVNWITQNIKVKKKIQQTRVDKGLTQVYEGKTMKEWADTLGVSYTYFKQVNNKHGFEAAKKLSLNKTMIEASMVEILNSIGVQSYQFDSTKFGIYRPDFIIEEKKLIIECDGLAWHCDRICKDKFYHQKKKQFYVEQGFTPLFFRSNEILFQKSIVSSIITNKLQNNMERFFARKLTAKLVPTKEGREWFNNNHLMGSGVGRIYGLYYNNKLICAIQVKWKKSSTKQLEISRFCTAKNTSVIGGYSKLIKHVENVEKPKQIITFVDERYGSGQYLTSLGFKKEKSYVSFMWTDGSKVFHRMNFRGNSGYKQGLFKIWDCGQTLYTKSSQ